MCIMTEQNSHSHSQQSLGQILEQNRAQTIRENCEEYREVLVKAYELLTWQKSFYAHAIFGLTVARYMLLWYFDMGILTMIALFGVKVVALDFFIPIYGKTLMNKPDWSETDERIYEQVCGCISECIETVLSSWRQLRSIRANQPKIYLSTTAMVLLVVAYIASVINNMFLLFLCDLTMYIVDLFMCMLPGLLTHGLLEKHCGKFFREAKQIWESKILKKQQ